MRSFTLVETLVAIFIFLIAMGGVSGLIVAAYRTYGYTWEQSIAIEEARRGVEIMVKEIREARPGEDGSYPIEIAGDKEIIFHSDIDGDGLTERVRYFLGTINTGTQTKECVTFSRGGSCNVTFSNFLQGNLKSAQVRVVVEGDLGASNEYAEIYADGIKISDVCLSGCSDCAGSWQGTTVLDVTSQANDNSIQFLADANSRVDPNCNWQEPNHSMKAQFEFSWTEEIIGAGNEFKKGVIKPIGDPFEYPVDQEVISALSPYVRNSPPIFEYFDANGNKILDYPARLMDTKLMRVFLIVDVNPNHAPPPFELESSVQLRNLKTE